MWSWIKFDNLGQVLAMALKFYSSVPDVLITTFAEVKGKKLQGIILAYSHPK